MTYSNPNTALRYRRLVSTLTPTEYANAALFYPVARCHVARMAEDHNIHHLKVALIVAATSPQTSWDLNLDRANYVLATFANEGRVPPTGLMSMVRTFCENVLLHGHKTIGSANARKIRAFAANLQGDENMVTIDRHMVTAAGIVSKNAPNKTVYTTLADTVRECAEAEGVTPATYQALVWAAERKSKGHKSYNLIGALA